LKSASAAAHSFASAAAHLFKKRKVYSSLNKKTLNRFYLEFFIAIRYLRAKQRQSILSVISVISMAGIAVGVMALIIVLAVMTGFEGDLKEKILGTNSHIVILKHGDPMIGDYKKAVSEIAAIDGVKAVSPFIYSQVMLSSGRRVSGVLIRGINPEHESGVTDLKKNLVKGSLADLEKLGSGKERKMPGIILGIELAKNLGVFRGDTVTLISPMGKMGPLGMVPRMKKMRVVGIFSAGMYEYDTGLAYISIRAAQKFFKMGDKVTAIEVKVNNVDDAREVGMAIKKKLGFPYWVRDWMDMNKNLFSALELEKLAMFIILILIVLVAAFNIIGTLIMMVTEKNKDIAILKTMGIKSRSIMRIFMLEGLVIGVVGTTVGGIVGTLICFLCDHFKLIKLQADVYYISSLPFNMQFWDVSLVCVLSLLISFLATIYPSRYAAALDPVVAIRYE